MMALRCRSDKLMERTFLSIFKLLLRDVVTKFNFFNLKTRLDGMKTPNLFAAVSYSKGCAILRLIQKSEFILKFLKKSNIGRKAVLFVREQKLFCKGWRQ